jgi:hypothetical protein
MITIRSKVQIAGLKGEEVTDFLLNPSDAAYQEWWRGTHLRLHPISGSGANPGDMVYMDEFIGARRVRMTGVVIESVRGRKIVWQLARLIRFPVWLTRELADADEGVTVTHTIVAGFTGVGRIFDPILRLYFSPEFATAMDNHVKAEFPKLRELLHR